MYHNYSFWRLGVSGWLWSGIGVLLIAAAIVLIIFLVKKSRMEKAERADCLRREGTPHMESTDAHGRIMEILRVQCDARQTNAADYEERRMVLDGGKTDDYQNTELVALKERYARLEIPTQEYIDARSKILCLS